MHSYPIPTPLSSLYKVLRAFIGMYETNFTLIKIKWRLDHPLANTLSGLLTRNNVLATKKKELELMGGNSESIDTPPPPVVSTTVISSSMPTATAPPTDMPTADMPTTVNAISATSGSNDSEVSSPDRVQSSPQVSPLKLSLDRNLLDVQDIDTDDDDEAPVNSNSGVSNSSSSNSGGNSSSSGILRPSVVRPWGSAISPTSSALNVLPVQSNNNGYHAPQNQPTQNNPVIAKYQREKLIPTSTRSTEGSESEGGSRDKKPSRQERVNKVREAFEQKKIDTNAIPVGLRRNNFQHSSSKSFNETSSSFKEQQQAPVKLIPAVERRLLTSQSVSNISNQPMRGTSVSSGVSASSSDRGVDRDVDSLDVEGLDAMGFIELQKKRLEQKKLKRIEFLKKLEDGIVTLLVYPSLYLSLRPYVIFFTFSPLYAYFYNSALIMP